RRAGAAADLSQLGGAVAALPTRTRAAGHAAARGRHRHRHRHRRRRRRGTRRMNATAAAIKPSAATATPLWTYALLAFVATAGVFYINIMSAIVDGLVTGWGFDNARAGTVAAANIYGASIGALVAALVVRRLRWRPTLALLLGVLLLLDLASIAVREP